MKQSNTSITTSDEVISLKEIYRISNDGIDHFISISFFSLYYIFTLDSVGDLETDPWLGKLIRGGQYRVIKPLGRKFDKRDYEIIEEKTNRFE